jgi:hypothetical protein
MHTVYPTPPKHSVRVRVRVRACVRLCVYFSWKKWGKKNTPFAMCVRAAYHQPTSPRKHFDSFFTQLIDPICLNSLLNLSSANVCLGSFSLKFYSTDGFTQFCSQPLSQFFTQLIISQQLVSRLVFTQVLLNLMDSRLCFLQKLRVKMNENVSRWSSLIFFYLRVDSLIFFKSREDSRLYGFTWCGFTFVFVTKLGNI